MESDGMNKIGSALFITFAALSASTPLSAHHGAGLFEPVDTVTVSGTVTDFQFVNPHVLIHIMVTGGDGDKIEWGGELTSPNRLARMNGEVKWHKTLLQPGDLITMTGHPARNGAPAMDITKIVDARGVALIGGDD
jgi:hypothetical protein